MRENIRFLVFWARLTSLRMMFSNSIHLPANDNISFFRRNNLKSIWKWNGPEEQRLEVSQYLIVQQTHSNKNRMELAQNTRRLMAWMTQKYTCRNLAIWFSRKRPKKWIKNNLFNKCFWKNWISTCRRLKLGPYISTLIFLNQVKINQRP
jgi:hypothetical protein